MPLLQFKKHAVKEVVSANRGKVAEGKVQTYLRGVEACTPAFTFNRIADAGAARGAFSAQAGDFQVFCDGKNWLLEVKEVAHAYRLPHKNFSPEQAARMHKRHLAGSTCLVLIYHSAEKLWRCPDFSTFLTREGGSWDLRGTPAQSLRVILDSQF